MDDDRREMTMGKIKTAEQYLIAQLERAERERDEAVEYADGVRRAEMERAEAERRAAEERAERCRKEPVFRAAENRYVRYEVASSYMLSDSDYGLGADDLRRAAAMDDDELFEWARKTYRGKGYLDVSPIKRRELLSDYEMAFGDDLYVSEAHLPHLMIDVYDDARLDEWCAAELDGDIKRMALESLREVIANAVDRIGR